MSSAAKKKYAEKADRMSAARRVVLRTGLGAEDSSACETAEAQPLSASQVRRTRQKRLDTTLNKVVSHCAWQSGLALSDHMAPLRADLVVDDMKESEVSDEVERIFGFDRAEIENTATTEDLKSPCWTSYGGLCEKSQTYKVVKTLSTQLQSFLKDKKLDACVTLLCFELCSADDGSDILCDDSHWFLLGCTICRPLTHVLLKLFPERLCGLTFSKKDGVPDVVTSQQFLNCLVLQHERAAGQWQPDAIQVSVACHCDYQDYCVFLWANHLFLRSVASCAYRRIRVCYTNYFQCLT